MNHGASCAEHGSVSTLASLIVIIAYRKTATEQDYWRRRRHRLSSTGSGARRSDLQAGEPFIYFAWSQFSRPKCYGVAENVSCLAFALVPSQATKE